MPGDLLAGVLAGLAVAMPIGAVGTYLVALAARERFPVAAGAALGVASVDGGYAVAAALGGVGLRSAVERVAGALTLAAALVLLVVAGRTLQLAGRRFRETGRPGMDQARRLTPGRAYLTLVMMTIVNPTTVVTFAAVVLGRSAGAGPTAWTTAALFALGAFVASAVWQLVLVGGGSVLGRLLAGRGGQLGIAVASAALMIGLAVAVLVG